MGGACLDQLDGGGGSTQTGGGDQGSWRGTPPWRSVGKFGVKGRGRHGEGEVRVIRFKREDKIGGVHGGAGPCIGYNMLGSPDNHISPHNVLDLGLAKLFRRLDFQEPNGHPFDVQTRPDV